MFRRSFLGVCLTAVLCSGFVGNLSAQSDALFDVPHIAGRYDTQGRGEMVIHQRGKHILLIWDHDRGISTVRGEFKEQEFVGAGGVRYRQMVFAGTWELRDRFGRTLQFGKAIVYPSAHAAQTIVVHSRRMRGGQAENEFSESFVKVRTQRSPTHRFVHHQR